MRVQLAASAILVFALGSIVAVRSQSPFGESLVVKAAAHPSKAHDDELTALAVSPDGHLLASGGGDKVVRLWSLPQGDRLGTLTGHSNGISSLAFAPGGRLLAVASEDKTVSLWSVPDGRRVVTLNGHPEWVRSVWVTPDGAHVLAQAGKELRVWSVPDGKLEKTSAFDGDDKVALMPDGRTMAIVVNRGGESTPAPDPRIVLWSLPDLQEVAVLRTTLEGTIGMINAVTVTPDGSTVVAASMRGIVAWSLADRRPTQLATDGVRRLAVTPDGKTVVGGSAGGRIGLWSLTDGRQIATATGHSRPIYTLAISADGRIGASGSQDSTARLWSLPDARPVAALDGHKGIVSFVLFTPDGGTLITGQKSNWELTGIDTTRGRVEMQKIKADAVIALWNVNPPAFRRYLSK